MKKISRRFNKRIEKDVVLATAPVLEVLSDILTEDLEAKMRELRNTNLNDLTLTGVVANLAEQRQIAKLRDIVTIVGD